ncbi:Hypothetical protein FKW44_023480, partial [Caligus rogercresseyi]
MLNANIAQLQAMEQQILSQQQQSDSSPAAGRGDSALQIKIQHILHEKDQLQQQIKQFQHQVEQQLAYTQHAPPPPPHRRQQGRRRQQRRRICCTVGTDYALGSLEMDQGLGFEDNIPSFAAEVVSSFEQQFFYQSSHI